MEDKLLELLASLRKNEISVEFFADKVEELLNGDLLTSIDQKKRWNVSFFIECLDSFDAKIPDCKGFFDRWKMSNRRLNGDFGYPRAQVIEEAAVLERYLRGEQTFIEGILLFFSLTR